MKDFKKSYTKGKYQTVYNKEKGFVIAEPYPTLEELKQIYDTESYFIDDKTFTGTSKNYLGKEYIYSVEYQ